MGWPVIETLAWTREAQSDYDYWQRHNTGMRNRINQLVLNTTQNPLSGIGQPRELFGSLSGIWSRKIDMTHRFVYAVNDTQLTILSCRYHVKTSMVFSG
ncbi:MAG TPA: Txe/YoeB family addiction module toxin [Gammaproteobacteria bacterium]|nr:Txe/YoeB family addiction module toxin [Gammaproteobacteria bacterium]